MFEYKSILEDIFVDSGMKSALHLELMFKGHILCSTDRILITAKLAKSRVIIRHDGFLFDHLSFNLVSGGGGRLTVLHLSLKEPSVPVSSIRDLLELLFERKVL